MFFMQVERNQGVVYLVLREYTVRLKFTTFITVIFCFINQVVFSRSRSQKPRYTNFPNCCVKISQN